MSSEVQEHAAFDRIRYAFPWEDAEILVAALQPRGRRCLSIGASGDNSLALLAAGAESVLAAELNPAQIACLELRVAAFGCLEWQELLQLLGVRACGDRAVLYRRCREGLSSEACAFWDACDWEKARSPASDGKFERYFAMFRRVVLPLCHSRRRVAELLESRSREERRRFHDEVWDNRRWRALFAVFFSRRVMGWLGRDPAFFRYVEGSVAERIRGRVRHALVELDPSANPYLRFILNGAYGDCLPPTFREENFPRIREALAEGRLEIHRGPVEGVKEARFDAFNLSDIFEYMSADATESVLRSLLSRARGGARLAYWNMLAPRSRPESLAHRLRPLEEEAARLFQRDPAFFYSRFVVEEVTDG
ncbi:MAG: DUF3419 family protein [Verrucomicrobiota bacterium]